MIKLWIFLFLAIAYVNGASQSVVVSNDSSKLVFPNNVAVGLKPVRGGKEVILTTTSLQVLISQSNYLFDKAKLLADQCEFLTRELAIRDSMIVALRREEKTLRERSDVYSNAYSQAKNVSMEYDSMVTKLVADVRKSQKDHRSARRKSFLRGAASGFLGAVLLSVVYLSTID